MDEAESLRLAIDAIQERIDQLRYGLRTLEAEKALMEQELREAETRIPPDDVQPVIVCSDDIPF